MATETVPSGPLMMIGLYYSCFEKSISSFSSSAWESSSHSNMELESESFASSSVSYRDPESLYISSLISDSVCVGSLMLLLKLFGSITDDISESDRCAS